MTHRCYKYIHTFIYKSVHLFCIKKYFYLPFSLLSVVFLGFGIQQLDIQYKYAVKVNMLEQEVALTVVEMGISISNVGLHLPAQRRMLAVPRMDIENRAYKHFHQFDQTA